MLPEKKLQNAEDHLQDESAERLLKYGQVAFLLVALIFIVAISIYIYQFGTTLSIKTDDWGVFGDYLGGLLNPAVGMVTIFLVIVNVRLQRQELRNSLIEMRNSHETLKKQNAAIDFQNFQNTFFNWLNSYNNIVSNVEVLSPSGYPTYRGYAALSFIYKHLLNNDAYLQNLFDILDSNDRELLRVSYRVEGLDQSERIEKMLLTRWREKKQAKEDFFEGGFRSLINLIDWIYSQPEDIVDEIKKEECFRIIRSQLTNAEKTFLLYESWSLEESVQHALADYSIVLGLKKTDDTLAKFMLARAKHLRYKNR